MPENPLLKLVDVNPIALANLAAINNSIQRPDLEISQDETLWKALRGINGLRALWVNASLIVSAARIFADEVPEASSEEYRELRGQGYILRISVAMAVAEAALHLIFHRFPRVYARYAVETYLDMTVTLGVVCGFHRPDFLEEAGIVL